jgi:hypothetical protein
VQVVEQAIEQLKKMATDGMLTLDMCVMLHGKGFIVVANDGTGTLDIEKDFSKSVGVL